MDRATRFSLFATFILLLSLMLPVAVCLSARPAQAIQSGQRAAAVPAKQVTRASWYGREFQGRRTASGAVFSPHKLTAAHRTLHLGSKVRVTELTSGRSVVVQINDRGPYWPGRGIDLSYAAARELGMVRRGVVRVSIEPVVDEKPPASPAPIVTAFSWPTIQSLPKAIVQ